MKTIKLSSFSPDLNLEIYQWFLKSLMLSTTFFFKTTSIPTATLSGSSSKSTTRKRIIKLGSISSTSTNTIAYTKLEWKSSFIHRKSLKRRIWAGIVGEIISIIIKMDIVEAQASTAPITRWPGNIPSTILMIKSILLIVIPLPLRICPACLRKFNQILSQEAFVADLSFVRV